MDIWTSRHVMLLWPKRELRDLNVSSSFANRIFTFPNVLFYNYTLCYVILCVCMYVRIANVSENRSEWSESGREQCPSKEKRTAVWKINTILTTARINSSPPTKPNLIRRHTITQHTVPLKPNTNPNRYSSSDLFAHIYARRTTFKWGFSHSRGLSPNIDISLSATKHWIFIDLLTPV